MPEKFDLAVIGAGPGGYEAALFAAERGMKTALVEKGLLGGTCLNRGCIPTKTLLHTAEIYSAVKKGGETGLSGTECVNIDMDALQRRKEEVLEGLRQGIASLMKKNRVTVYGGNALLLDPKHIKIGTGDAAETIEAEKIIIATGSVPAVLPVKGAELNGVMTSDDILKSSRLYSRLVIIGGGVIGMEFASLYSDLGRPVTIIEAADRILPGMDREIAQNLKMILKKRGADIHTGAMVEEICRDGEGLSCRYKEKGETLSVSGDGILLATGRRPWTGGLIGEESSAEIKALAMERGYILTNSFQQTGIPSIYAIGDVTPGIQLAHAATAQGRLAVAHMLGLTADVRLDLIPACVYTSPEIASVGITADEAKAAGTDTVTKKYPMSANGKSVLSGQERGFIKVICDKASGRILGAQMMCARATDMIGLFTAAIANGMTAGDIGKAVFPHPTFSEGIAEALRD